VTSITKSEVLAAAKGAGSLKIISRRLGFFNSGSLRHLLDKYDILDHPVIEAARQNGLKTRKNLRTYSR